MQKKEPYRFGRWPKKRVSPRVALSKIANSKGFYNTTAETIERLCRYFACTPNDLISIIADQ
ncbi:MAG: helix-turn-helix domain-containing protein [Deltaproteobacteria bacterium]|nr:helix-turn-helix domain-containing protein [Deltaproteobacteria bacterium]